ncbi:hypothetical protein GLOIN_2v1836556 [Rhizophagus irregularis DAOM 181602=DAOM 197198]|uniref:Uncharacterized protein n=1 Tax=Rhizophagus irregularis (strain DAOM 181602 / DAOM 197198 / MUCL 43194) TaxID=747089 RepID=A0A2P4QMZ0_RHIID|nr:hypothetical protein GLOIN_2v1836556 [Rhizophagus irregularis DAOM 181602=DAOM 197198]POG79009.1 hypothetical protein GLOIN_2v1836556 [Rhizophagus irregularis DAOM 181602=DAOM 197198]|eukprot:XP_025185875.1 hypothetical protein GLOIN_2v1836556 [Rhizophagus irregularis DAOM 181602=DAOM 197198]
MDEPICYKFMQKLFTGRPGYGIPLGDSFRIYLSLESFNALIGRMNIFRLKPMKIQENILTDMRLQDLVRWWFHRRQFRARELAMDEADRLREQQEIELEQHRLQTLEEERKQREEAMEAELNKKF